MRLSKYFKSKGVYPILYVLLLTLAIQAIVTYVFTRTKRFSIRALVRNLSIAFAIYFSIRTGNYFLLLLPIALEFILEILKLNGYDMDPYVATEYLYSDYFIDRTLENPLVSNFTEANFDGLLGFNTTNSSSENNKRIHEWCKYAYLESINKSKSTLYDLNGQQIPEPAALKKLTDDRKFELISKKCGIKKGMRILEIGFGNGEFMDYIYKHYGIRPIGVSIANEQIKLVRDRGFEAYHMNYWDMTPDVVGTFDLILQCGNLEYTMRTGHDHAKIYTQYCQILNTILNPHGKYFITCCHVNKKYNNGSINWSDYSFDYILHTYVLWAGNDGLYPLGRDGFSKYANQTWLQTIYQEDRTNDYLITSTFYFSYFQCSGKHCVNSFSIPSVLEALFKTIAGPYYIHSYLCYLATNYYIWCPFHWEFVPQEEGGKWQPPITLQYILFQKSDSTQTRTPSLEAFEW